MSSSNLPFHPMGPTITFTAVTGTPPAGQQAPIAPTTSTSAGQYRIINASSVLVFLGVGSTSAEAISRADAVATSIPLLPGTDEVLRFGSDAFFTGKSSSGSAVIYMTPGQGL
jgi:tartrate dehydratase beta subunit/fumarate hydratase class I family protein